MTTYVQDTLTGEPVGVDMPASATRSRLLAAIRTGKYSAEFAYHGDRRWVTADDVAQIWAGVGNRAQAKLVRDLSEVGDNWWLGGAITRRMKAAESRPGPADPIDGPCIRDLYRALGMHVAAQMHGIAEALTLDTKGNTPHADVRLPLTPGQVRTLTAAVKS